MYWHVCTVLVEGFSTGTLYLNTLFDWLLNFIMQYSTVVFKYVKINHLIYTKGV